MQNKNDLYSWHSWQDFLNRFLFGKSKSVRAQCMQNKKWLTKHDIKRRYGQDGFLMKKENENDRVKSIWKQMKLMRRPRWDGWEKGKKCIEWHKNPFLMGIGKRRHLCFVKHYSRCSVSICRSKKNSFFFIRTIIYSTTNTLAHAIESKKMSTIRWMLCTSYMSQKVKTLN